MLSYLSLGLCLPTAGCAPSGAERRAGAPPRARPDADLLALLPSGLDAVMDADVAGLRRLDLAPDLLDLLLTEKVQRHLRLFGPRPLLDLDALCAGVQGLGTEQVGLVLVAQGRLSPQHLIAAFQALAPGATETDYHGITVLEPAAADASGAGLALALLTERTAVSGSRGAVRQVIDNLHGDGDSARTQTELMAALGKAPRAREGRPALLLGLVPPAPLRDRLRQADLSEFGAESRYLAAALAVGDGLDLGAIAGYDEFPKAKDAEERLLARIRRLRYRPMLALLSIGQLLDPVVLRTVRGGPHRSDPELHLAYRLPEDDLRRLVTIMAKLRGLRDRLHMR